MTMRRSRSNPSTKRERASSVTVPARKEEGNDLSAVRDGDDAAWRRFVAAYDGPLRAVVRDATDATHSLTDDQVDDVMGDFWLALVAKNRRMLRAYDPSRGTDLLTWLTFHVAQLAHAHLQRLDDEPDLEPFDETRHVPVPCAPTPRLRNEAMPTVDDAIRAAVREAVAVEVRQALARAPHPMAPPSEEGFISINRAAEIADTHPATIRTWIRAGRLRAGRTGRHYKVRKSDVIKIIEGCQHNEITVDHKARIAAIMAGDRPG